MAKPHLTVTQGTSGLRVNHLRKSYKKRVVIRDFSMELNRGEVVALLGPNGSGKSTTFYAIAGLVYPEGGEVTIDGRDVTNLPMYRRANLGIGYLPQEMSIFRGLSVEDNIAAILDITEKDRHKRRERLESCCPLRLRFPAGNAAVSKSRAALQQIRGTCCLMNPSQV